jgi:enoyl-CoA hydratase
MDSLTTTQKGEVCILTLDDGKVNALSPDLIAAIHERLDAAEQSAQAVMITGRPDRFSAGFNLKLLREGGPEAAIELVSAGGRLYLRFLEYPLPIVIGCTGHALAAGAIALLTADYRVGAQGEYQIGLNETLIGMTLPEYGVEFARACLSKRYFDRAVVHGEIFDPQGALAAGYLDRVVAPDHVFDTALAEAERLARLPRGSFAGNKRKAHAATIAQVGPGIEADVRGLMGA